jgi:hypothetical protein
MTAAANTWRAVVPVPRVALISVMSLSCVPFGFIVSLPFIGFRRSTSRPSLSCHDLEMREKIKKVVSLELFLPLNGQGN